MNKELNIFTLRMLRDQYEAEHMDTEVEALDAAIEALEQPDLQPTCNQLATDCISRQAGLDVAHKSIFEFFDICDDNSEEPINEKDKLLLEVNKAICNSIKDLPSAQPEIIRCRDCKHYYYADNRIPQEQRYVCDISGEKWKPDDFCSYAERRTDG